MARQKIVHREVIHLDASPVQVRAFVLTPERILDYYPGGFDCGVFEAGQSFYCRGKSGVSLLELDKAQSNESTCVLKVTTSLKAKPPYDRQKILDQAFFTMYEDWQIEADGVGTRLTKTWRDVQKHQLRFMPMGLIVRRSAKAETAVLQRAWNDAAMECAAREGAAMESAAMESAAREEAADRSP